jgi:nucleotide-binding universal stress UspA family protein
MTLFKCIRIAFIKSMIQRGACMLYSKILVAYDGSVESDEALNHAIHLCECFSEASLQVVHIYSIPSIIIGEAMINPTPNLNNELLTEALAVVDRAKSRVASIPQATVEMVQGNAAITILAYAEERNMDLIVLGSRGLGGVREFVLGSVSHQVVQQARIPVLVVKTPEL